MRRFVALALLMSLVSINALAAPKGGKAKGKKGRKDDSGVNMDASGDPTPKETSDGGPFRPQGKTGTLAREEELKEEQERVEAAVAARPRAKRLFFGDLVLGFGQAPQPGPATASGGDRTNRASPVVGLNLGGTYDLSPALTLGLRIPWSTSAVKSTGNNQTESSMAFGSPNIGIEYRTELSLVTSVPVFFAVGVPLAQGNPDPTTTTDYNGQIVARTNLLADAASGWKDAELYWTKRVPLTLGVGIRHDKRSWEAHAWTKLTAGINFGKALADTRGPTADTSYKLNGVALRNVTLAGISLELLANPDLWVGLDAWLVYNAIEPIEFVSNAKKKLPLQVVAEPRVGMRFGKFQPSLGFLFPLGGRLADTGIVGARAHAEYAW